MNLDLEMNVNLIEHSTRKWDVRSGSIWRINQYPSFIQDLAR